jgi:O-antigen/teichoic acid export membrane protein
MTAMDEVEPVPNPPAAALDDPPVAPRGRLVALLHRRATWVLADQGVVSAGNFVLGVLLARNLNQIEYGAFIVLFETIVYLNSLQAALVIYPLTIKGATGDRAELGRLATAAMILTLGLLPLLGGATIASVGALRDWGIAITAVAALLLWQLQETLRRGLMSDLRFADAVAGDAVSYLGQAALIFLLAWAHALNLNRAFLVMAVTSAAGIVIQALQIGLKPIRFWQLKLVARDFWRLGRWTMLTNGSGLITGIGYQWTLLFFWGRPANALFGAIAQFLKLANPIVSSMSGLITPAVARADANDGHKAAARVALRYIALGAAMLTPFFIFLLIFATPLLKFLSKGGADYYQHANLLRLFVANYVMVFVLTMVGAWLMGLRRSRYNFYAQVFNIVVTLLIGLPITAFWGVRGLILGALSSCVANAMVSIYFIHRVTHTEQHSE